MSNTPKRCATPIGSIQHFSVRFRVHLAHRRTSFTLRCVVHPQPRQERDKLGRKGNHLITLCTCLPDAKRARRYMLNSRRHELWRGDCSTTSATVTAVCCDVHARLHLSLSPMCSNIKSKISKGKICNDDILLYWRSCAYM